MMTKEMVYAAAASSSLANAQDEYNELRFEFGIELDDVLLWVQTRLPLNDETRPKSYFVWNDPCTINVPLVFVCKY
ncbi:uncharacterized protein LOC110869128 isoform X7 [Helianthus annuus]|uniref:uncharacterized protein LOC110869128 isoform X7 n=1 Tax=Helianthus annuus TaxID=4232 RepID=UPI000B8FA7F6|nr:uncharacterized protein LOC110869128 isoform X7 [Helianthus annuus]